MKNEKITRIQWGPSGITIYTTYGMFAKITERDEMELFSDLINKGFASVENLQEAKKEKENELQISAEKDRS